jgi:signal transduction histidine kinase
VSAQNHAMVVYIADPGINTPVKCPKRILEVFPRARNARKTAGGFGPYIVVSSVENHGKVITVCLPLTSANRNGPKHT